MAMKSATGAKAAEKGSEVWILSRVNDYGVKETASAHTSFAKALNAAKRIFRESGLMDAWRNAAAKELKEWWFYRDHGLFNGDRFIIDRLTVN